MELSYLACPYKHEDEKIMKARVEMATQVACRLIKQGILVYSPLTHDVPIDQCGIFGDWKTWREHNHAMLLRCDRIIVLKLPGWEKSNGVQGEIIKARQNGMTIHEMEADMILWNEILNSFLVTI